MSGKNVGDSPKSVEILIKYGCDIYKKDEDGNNAIHISASTCALESMKVYKKHFGSEVFKIRNDEGMDCMMVAPALVMSYISSF